MPRFSKVSWQAQMTPNGAKEPPVTPGQSGTFNTSSMSICLYRRSESALG
jgi:hypothetical protein